MQTSNMDKGTDILNAKAAAQFLGITRGFLYKLTSERRIPFYKPVGKHIFFRMSELDAWVNAGRMPTVDEMNGRRG